MINWQKKNVWHSRGNNFLVEVYHYTVGKYEFDHDGSNRWNVYAYIYPTHPHFEAFTSNDMWQEAATIMPFHSYPSHLSKPMYDGKVTCVKVGSDYNHLYDEDFTFMDTKEEAWEVFQDAERLYNWLTGPKLEETE